MIETGRRSAGPIRLTGSSAVALRPATRARVTGGLWASRREINRDVCVPQGWDRLHEAGNYANLELAAGRGEGAYTGELPFLDSDVYKWLEAVAWTLDDPDLEASSAEKLLRRLAESTELLAVVQQPDGYLDSHFQVRFPGERFVQLPWGHELYCAGHLIQAAVALHRSTGDEALLGIARRVADLVVVAFGTEPGRVDGVCGHPEIETALVELYRETGEQAYLDRARYFVDRRGHGLLGSDRFGRHYWQDHEPVREATAVVGHAVRQLYLLAGVADVYVETGDQTLLDACARLWDEMVATQTYLTGGVGAHHRDEAFGDPYELPNERSYCETCAAIASIHLSWRMLMITGEAKYADLLERTLYNGFLAGLSLDGQRYIYANPLQVRDDHVASGDDGDYLRVPWFRCACCPPNVMRLLASLEHYVLLSSDDTVTLHQYMSGDYAAELGEGEVVLEVLTDYPWDGAVQVGVAATPDEVWTLALRVPAWGSGAELSVNGEPVLDPSVDGWWRVTRAWEAGDVAQLRLPLEPRLTAADPRVDAARGSLALERGPLVYCLEGVDHDGHRLDDLLLDADGPLSESVEDGELGRIVRVEVAGATRPRTHGSWWPYAPATGGALTGGPVTLSAVPYFTWGNRGSGGMRVWVPTA
ncbi:glycoside hydrolase family 127 protein [uncultured Friedmanniella sp.]|uniref:glycoside hydrolase family 127 protein n=1 Tax=uncultured Friedmanniella sp. TaxID=335381 RepID=UPI0035CC5D67